MTSRGKSINLYLMDGAADGRIKCTLANWTGVAYKLPRTEIEACRDREDLKQSGVYLLFGVSDDTGEGVVYIGQAGERKNGEGLLNRLLEHKRNPDKDYWTEAVVFTTANNSFGPTEISYLENRFCAIALEAGRYAVKNASDPTQGHVTEEKESELEEFIDNAKVVMGALGHRVFQPVSAPEDRAGQPLYLKGRQVNATGKRTSEGFVVLRGSRIGAAPTEKCPESVRRLRERYQDRVDSSYILRDDVPFTSPSAAAGFVKYSSVNGLTAWVAEDGRPLGSLERGEAVPEEGGA